MEYCGEGNCDDDGFSYAFDFTVLTQNFRKKKKKQVGGRGGGGAEHKPHLRSRRLSRSRAPVPVPTHLPAPRPPPLTLSQGKKLKNSFTRRCKWLRPMSEQKFPLMDVKEVRWGWGSQV